jgi:hypothetical protein
LSKGPGRRFPHALARVAATAGPSAIAGAALTHARTPIVRHLRTAPSPATSLTP